MKRTVFLLLVYIFSLNSLAQVATDLFDERPTWVEDFSGKGYDLEKNWNVSDFFNEDNLAYYVKSERNVFVTGGKLSLILRKENYRKYSYTSGRIVSKRTFRYGKLEFRAKCPVSRGVWNAVWLRDKQRESCFGEIDLLEHIGCWGKSKYQMNFHLWGTFGGQLKNHKQHQRFINIDISKYHVYTIEWLRDTFIAFVDGEQVCSFNKNEIEEWPFDKEFNLVIALAYGGSWAGSCGLDDAALPQSLKIDWIKYYPLKNNNDD